MSSLPADLTAHPAEMHAVVRRFVLVADDSPEMRSLLTDLLEQWGYEVKAVPSGPRALAEMADRTPAVLITDLFMPGMSGFSLRSLMLRRAELAHIPVVVLSAYWHRPRETLEVAEVLTKPLDIDRLRECIERVAPLSNGDGIRP